MDLPFIIGVDENGHMKKFSQPQSNQTKVCDSLMVDFKADYH